MIIRENMFGAQKREYCQCYQPQGSEQDLELYPESYT
jgi:hypothetical protein